MTTKLNIAFFFLLTALLSGCIEEHFPPGPDVAREEQAKVGFRLLLPLADLPSTRAIANDSQIDDYTVWVFNNDTFVEAVKKGDTYTDAAGAVKDKITYNGINGGSMYIVLNTSLTSVKLMMVANCDVTAPAAGTTWADAETSLQRQTFSYDGTQNDMPMYGVSDTPFAVKQGAEGVIQLRRCMAKVVVDASDAKDHFKLEKIGVYQVNDSGTVAPKDPITNLTNPLAESISGTVDGATNKGTVYLPEIAGIKSGSATKTYVILTGKYTPKGGGTPVDKYCRLDFIKREKDASSGNVSYEAIDMIERNHAYIFDVQYLTAEALKDNLNDACNSAAANIISETTITVKITDENIMDITTNNYIYLGVTAGHIDAVLNTDTTHYAAQIHVITNNPNGWKMDALPEGVTAIPNEYTPPTGTTDPTVQSVWVYLPEAAYNPDDEIIVYIYSGNIRKSIVIKIPS